MFRRLFMKLRFPILAIGAALLAVSASAQEDKTPIKHVMLISIDGMHAVDFQNCVHGVAGVNNGEPYCPNLAKLNRTGVSYVNASTSKTSDSFPGLMTIVTGATPRTMGIYYDVAYDRSLDGPAVATWYGNGPGTCTPGSKPTGFTTEYEEAIDIDYTKLNGGAPGASLIDGTEKSLDTTRMDRDPARGCAPVLPTDFVRVNSIFGLIHAAGGYVAWSDKHPSYSSVAGHGGALDDFYGPEINSLVVPIPGVKTPDGVDCSSIPDTAADLTAWTNSFTNIKCYDTLKVNAVLNWINGKKHLGGPAPQTPTIFGMNFQAVSVGQKYIENGLKGGYTDAAATPTSSLVSDIVFADDSIGEMIQALRGRGLLDSTLIIITAKHGQSPIDPNQYNAVPGKTSNGLSPATLISNQLHAAMPPSEDPNGTGVGATEDDVSLLWLTNSSYTDAAVSLLEANRTTWGGGQIYFGATLALNYNDPTKDPRTPDIIVTPTPGVTYTGSNTKQMEHGGFAHDDTNVMLLMSNPSFRSRTIFTEVGTLQIAPTILNALGMDSGKLDGVRLEGTQALPDVSF
jgi:hypothetical protein